MEICSVLFPDKVNYKMPILAQVWSEHKFELSDK